MTTKANWKKLFGQEAGKALQAENIPNPSPTIVSKPQPPGPSFVQRLIGLDAANGTCADCSCPIPTTDAWTSINNGVILCIVCSGTHRSLGTHISKVRSLNLDALAPEVVWIIQSIGNGRANHNLEARLDPGLKPPLGSMPDVKSRFVQQKYAQRSFAVTNPMDEGLFMQRLFQLMQQGEIGPVFDWLVQAGPCTAVSQILKKQSSPILIQAFGIQPNFLREGSQTSLEASPPPSPSFQSTDPFRFAMAEFLLLNGVDINAQLSLNGRSTTALHCAVGAHDLEMLQYLLNRGGDPMVRDDEGKLPVGKSRGEEKKLLLISMSKCTPRP
jgi:hypothetical protein